MGSPGVNADPLYHYQQMPSKAGSSVSCVRLVLRRPWQRQNGSASSGVMVRAKARAIVVYIYIAMEHRG